MDSSQNEIATLIGRLAKLSPKLSNEDDEKSRKEALILSKSLTAKFEQPENVAVELAFSALFPMCARIAVDLKLFELILNNDGPVTASQLSVLSGGEELLVVRVLRPLAAAGFVEEVGAQTWKATKITKAMANDGIASGHRMLWELIVGAASKAPRYLAEAGYRCPTDPHDGLVQYAFQTKLGTFDFLSSRPRLLEDFSKFMGNTMGARKYWVDWFPCQTQIIDGATRESPLVVDIGGGRGHDILAFHEKFPGQGRLVLQDLEPVIGNIQGWNAAVERGVYDFFTEQPLKNARVYFYHHILHDWSDSMCLKILQNVKKAMKPGYSKLLLHEMIIPETGASNFHSMLDMTMMAFNGGMERTGSQWKALLATAGFEVLKVWVPPEDDADGIVEAIVVE